jgi:hypothetical protein
MAKVLGSPAFGYQRLQPLITATMSIDLKLLMPGDPTRRLTFTDKPSWSLLASKIESYYGIPASNVGVSYIDNDGDEVTLSSEDELNNFSYIASETTRFTVKDLRPTRECFADLPCRY